MQRAAGLGRAQIATGKLWILFRCLSWPAAFKQYCSEILIILNRPDSAEKRTFILTYFHTNWRLLFHYYGCNFIVFILLECYSAPAKDAFMVTWPWLGHGLENFNSESSKWILTWFLLLLVQTPWNQLVRTADNINIYFSKTLQRGSTRSSLWPGTVGFYVYLWEANTHFSRCLLVQSKPLVDYIRLTIFGFRIWSVWLRCGWTNTPNTSTCGGLSIATCQQEIWQPRRSWGANSAARASSGSWAMWPGICLNTTHQWNLLLQPGER